MKRHIASWLLLAVFVPSLLVAALHVHPSSALSDGDCSQCVHHQNHGGHLSSAKVGAHDCVLCQLCHAPFLLTASLALVVPCGFLRSLTCRVVSATCVGRIHRRCPRAPPVC